MSALLRAVIGACILCGSLASWAVAQELPLVFVEQSEGLVEMQIDDYLRKTEGFTITIDEYDGIPDDLFLRFENTFRDAPELSFLVDTLQSATNNDDVVTERVIKITSWYILNVTPGHWARAPVLEMINTYLQEFWAPPKIYLDGDGDIRFEWFVNVPAADAPPRAHSGHRIPTAAVVMQDVQIGRSQFEQESSVSRSGWR